MNYNTSSFNISSIYAVIYAHQYMIGVFILSKDMIIHVNYWIIKNSENIIEFVLKSIVFMNITHGVVNLNSLWPTNVKMRSVQPIQAHYVKISNLYAHVIMLF